MDRELTQESTPIIPAEHLRLVPFGPQHMTPAYVGWLNDPAVVRYSEQRHRVHTLETCRAYFESMRRGGHYFWAIEETERGIRHIGNLSATVDRPNAVADLAIMVGERSAQGRGLGKEAWIAACEWAIGDGGMGKISAGTMSENQAMLALFKAAGMKIEAVRKAHFVLDGRPVDAVYAARFSPSHR